jgi:hypothetical protein
MPVKNRKWFIPLMLLPLLWVEVSEAFCFSFGTGNNRRADHYNGPFPAPFPPGGYPVYPYSPAVHGWYGPPGFGLPFVSGDYRRGYAPVEQK